MTIPQLFVRSIIYLDANGVAAVARLARFYTEKGRVNVFDQQSHYTRQGRLYIATYVDVLRQLKSRQTLVTAAAFGLARSNGNDNDGGTNHSV